MVNNIRNIIYNNAVLKVIMEQNKFPDLTIIANMIIFEDIDIKEFIKVNKKKIELYENYFAIRECERLLKEGEKWALILEMFRDKLNLILKSNKDIYIKYQSGLVDKEVGYESARVLLGIKSLRKYISVLEANLKQSSKWTDSIEYLKVDKEILNSLEYFLTEELPDLPEDPYKEIIGDE